jgi:hypothetical protein
VQNTYMGIIRERQMTSVEIAAATLKPRIAPYHVADWKLPCASQQVGPSI